MYKGYERRLVKEVYAPTREIVYMTYKVAAGKKAKSKKQFWPLPGEKPVFDLKEMKSAFEQALKNNKNNGSDLKGKD